MNKEKFLEGRKVLFCMDLDSKRFNLKDGKKRTALYVTPTAKEVFTGNYMSHYDSSNNLVYKSALILSNYRKKSIDFNFFDIFYDMYHDATYCSVLNPESSAILTKLHDMRDEITRMCLYKVYISIFHKLEMCEKSLKIQGRTHLSIYYIIRQLNLLKHFTDNDFRDYDSVRRFDKDSEICNVLNDFYVGIISDEEGMTICRNLAKDIRDNYKKLYLKMAMNMEVIEKYENLVVELLSNETIIAPQKGLQRMSIF